MTETRHILAAYAAEAPFAISLVLGKTDPQRELLDLARRANEDSSPTPPDPGSCIDTDLAERFSMGLVPPASEVALARHVAACPTCDERLEEILDAGHAVERASVCAAVQHLRERSFMNTRSEVRGTWRYLLKWNIVATITETLVSVTLIAGLIAHLADGMPAVSWLLLATVPPTMAIYLAVVLPRIRRWRDDVLTPSLPDERFVAMPSTSRSPRELTDLTTSWQRFTREVTMTGIGAYALWGGLAAIIAGRWWLAPISLLPGILSNAQALLRMRRIQLEWFFEDSLHTHHTQLAMKMRDPVWLLVFQFAIGFILLVRHVDATSPSVLVVMGFVAAVFAVGPLVVMMIWSYRDSGHLASRTPS